jgi:KaiC/GvpD/RAD55 family RecA-like ATPase
MSEARLSKLARRAQEHAALSGVFDPARFLYDTSPQEPAVMARLGRVSREIIGPDGRVRWRMRDRDRAKILQGLVRKQGTLGKRLRKRAPLSDDLFAQVLALCLHDSAKLSARAVDRRIADVRKRTKGARATLLREAIAALTFAGPLLSGRKRDTAREIERGLRAETIRDAIAARQEHILPHGLSGREDERRAVLDFIFGAAREGETTPAMPPITRLRGPQTTRPYRSLLVTGSPGMGKSAFLTDLAQRLKRHPARPLVIAFDFDQMTLAHGGRVAWMAETTRQIALEAPALATDLSRMRAEQALITATRRNESAQFDEMLHQTRAILGADPALAGRPIVLLLDTLEEITAQNNPRAFADTLDDTVFIHLDTWAERMTTLLETPVSALFTGRNAPPVAAEVLSGLFHAHLNLPKLTAGAAAELIGRLLPALSPQDCDAIATAVYGHPLLLIIIGKHLKPLSKKERAAEIADLRNLKLDGQDALATLYTRFLQRMRLNDLPDGLSEADMRKLAHPGLLLPEVTADLLRDVIAPAVGVDLSAPGHGEAAFRALAEQIWLVRVTAGGDAVSHDREVRRIMLPLMLGKDDDEVHAVLTNGIAHYERAGKFAEAGYLRGLRGETDWLFSGPEGIADQVYSLMGAEDLSLFDISVSATIRRIVRPDDQLSDAEIRALPENMREAAILDQQTESIRKTGRTSSATTEQAPATGAPQRTGSRPLYDVVTDERLNLRIGNAFVSGAWEDAHRIGWEAILDAEIGDVNAPIRTGVPFHESWLWRLTLISMVLDPPGEVRDGGLPSPGALAERLEGQMIRSPDSIIFDLDMLAATAMPDDTRSIPDIEALGMGRYNGFLVNMRMMREMAQSPLFRAGHRTAALHPDVAMASASHAFLAEHMQTVAGSIRCEPKRKSDEDSLPIRLARAVPLLSSLSGTALQDLLSEYHRAELGDGGLVLARLPDASLQAFRAFVIGQVPECHDMVAGAMLDAGIGAVMESLGRVLHASHLPRDTDLLSLLLSGEQSRSSTTEVYQGFIVTVRRLDLLGLLQAVVRDLAKGSDDSRLAYLTRLFDVIDARWRPPLPL